MDLNSIIVNQIEESARERKAKQEAAKKEEEEEAKKEAAARKIAMEEAERQFNVEKKIFEESFVREIMAVIIQGVNSPTNKQYSSLRKRVFEIARINSQSDVRNDSKFSLKDPYSFVGDPSYIIRFRFDEDYYFPIIAFTIKNNQINYCCPMLLRNYTNSSIKTISSNKEEAAAEIIKFLMTE